MESEFEAPTYKLGTPEDLVILIPPLGEGEDKSEPEDAYGLERINYGPATFGRLNPDDSWPL